MFLPETWLRKVKLLSAISANMSQLFLAPQTASHEGEALAAAICINQWRINEKRQ